MEQERKPRRLQKCIRIDKGREREKMETGD